MPKYAEWNAYESRLGGVDCHVSIRCGETINCRPPYIKGARDLMWSMFPDAAKIPAATDKEGWERKLGMRLEPL